MKQNRHYIVKNGFRNRVVRLFKTPNIMLPTTLLVLTLLGLLFWFDQKAEAGGVVLANLPTLVNLEIDKSNLSGENLEFMVQLEKRIKAVPDKKVKEDLINLFNESNKEMTEMAKRFKDLDDDKIATIKEIIGTDEKGIRSIVQKQGQTIAKLVEKLEARGEDMSVRAQVSRWQERNKVTIEKIKSKNKSALGDLEPLEIRLNSPMTPANTFTAGGSEFYIPRPEFENGATEIVRAQPTFWDYVTKGRTSSAVYVWVNKKNPEGAAGFIGPGVAKPGISLELESEVSKAKKVAASDKIAIELLDDVEGFASYVEQELRFQVDKKTNTELMSGVESSTNIPGIQTLSVPYSLVGVQTDNPNNWDCLVANEAQLRAGNLSGVVTHFVSPVDRANMRLTKAISQGQLFVPALPDGVIVEDNNIAVGYVQSAILQYFNVKIYKDYTVSFGLENDDFTKNLVTAVGERRLHVYMKENHTGAFIYDTFVNIKAGIAVG